MNDDDGVLPEVLRDPHVRVPLWFRLTVLIAAGVVAIVLAVLDIGPARWMSWTDSFHLRFLTTLLVCIAGGAAVILGSAYVWPKDPREPKDPPRAIARDRRR